MGSLTANHKQAKIIYLTLKRMQVFKEYVTFVKKLIFCSRPITDLVQNFLLQILFQSQYYEYDNQAERRS
jgi:hypothetical protein